MKRLIALVLANILVGCTPAVGQTDRDMAKPVLAAEATEQNGELTFQIINISNQTILAQSNYCFDQPAWEIKYTNGNIYNLPLVENVNKSDIQTVHTCVAVLLTKSLAPGEKIVLKRKLDLPPGSYTVRSWVNPVVPRLPGDGRLEAPIINVSIP